jgi:hypothetical protein
VGRFAPETNVLRPKGLRLVAPLILEHGEAWEAALRRAAMQKYLVVAVLLASFTAPVLAAETYYIIFDTVLKGCTISTDEPTDKTRYTVLGKYKSNAEAAKAIASMKQC